MSETTSHLSADNADPVKAEVAGLVETFEKKDGVERQRARKRLAEIGHPAVPALIESLNHDRDQVRWESAKTLVEIADPTAASALVDALEDENMDVRWVAAEGLIVLEEDALRPLFEALVKRSKSVWLREGAHHVLHELRDGPKAELIAPVLTALGPAAPRMEAAVTAHAALHQLRK